MFSKRDQFCSFWDQFCRFVYFVRLGDHFCAGITFAAVQESIWSKMNVNRSLINYQITSVSESGLDDHVVLPIAEYQVPSDKT